MKLLRLKIIISLCVLLIPSLVYAQANTLSNITVYTSIGLDTLDSFKHQDKIHAFKCQAIRLGINNGINQLVKNVVHKQRPDGSDNKSFYSNHTSNAFVSSGWNYSVGITLGITTGALRIVAKKHDWIDVSVGAITGLIIQQVCDK